MDDIIFECNENKFTINHKKHKISFEEAKSVFYDEFIILGLSRKANLLVVCHCYRASETIIRIFSARKATPAETRQYEN